VKPKYFFNTVVFGEILSVGNKKNYFDIFPFL
jgi:hypothetical protein